MRIVLDIETNNLKGDVLWCVATKDVDTGETRLFADETLKDAPGYLSRATKVIGHNVIAFDYPVLQRHFPGLLEPVDGFYDTLVASRLYWYGMPDGHSLEAWGKRLGIAKRVFQDWDNPGPEMYKYCQQDVEVTAAVWNKQARFHTDKSWASAIETEHRAAMICRDMTAYGFMFDIEKARNLHAELSKLLADLDEAILAGFPPKVLQGKVVVPRVTKFGTLSANDFRWVEPDASGVRDLSSFSEGCAFTRIGYETFNPGSPKQVVERLNKLGWQPFEKTKGHLKFLRDRFKDPVKKKHYETYGWSISEANLATLPVDAPPAAHKLAQRLLVASRVADLVEWMREYNPDTGRVHGSFITTGSWTGRMAHQRPNTGNISSTFNSDRPREEWSPVEVLKDKYDGQLRSLWKVPDGCWQVGVDMDSAHLRILAHLIDEKDFTQGLISGNKKDKTDPHSMNQKALGSVCQSRDDAKTFIYLWLNGGKAAKLAATLKWPLQAAKDALVKFTKFYPGLDFLMNEEIPKDAQRGYFIGIDGRKVAYDKEHGMLAGYLQNAESIILKRAAWLGRLLCEKAGLPIKLLNLVHDEIQIEVRSPDKAVAQQVGEIFADCYRQVAEEYGLRCPFAGGITIGKNWAGAH